jgi:hypothetical protein
MEEPQYAMYHGRLWPNTGGIHVRATVYYDQYIEINKLFPGQPFEDYGDHGFKFRPPMRDGEKSPTYYLIPEKTPLYDDPNKCTFKLKYIIVPPIS